MSTSEALRFAVFQAANGAGLGQDIIKELFVLSEVPTRRAELWQKSFVQSLNACDVLVLNSLGFIPEAVITGCPHTRKKSPKLDEIKKRWSAALDKKPNMVLARTLYLLYQTNAAHQVFDNLNHYSGLSEAIHLANHADSRQRTLKITEDWITHKLRAHSSYTLEQKELFRQQHQDILDPMPAFKPKPLGYVF
jgi:hypothetical protein